jgi:hypothetical protein
MQDKLFMKAPASTAGAYVEDVFSTYLYTGTGASNTITNGIDLSGEGGLVWIKCRNDVYEHKLTDTARGAQLALVSNVTAAQASEPNGLTAFTSSGFTVGSDGAHNASAQGFVSWTFRKAKKFFDVQTWTGNSVANRQLAHNLGSVPGCVIIKCTSTAGEPWLVYHRSLGASNQLRLNTTDGVSGPVDEPFNYVEPTTTHLNLAQYNGVNGSGKTYVAYLFAHDAGGFGDAGDQSVIKCGSYTGNGSTLNVDVGFEAQWVMIKRTDTIGNWLVLDNLRGMSVFGSQPSIYPNTTAAEEKLVKCYAWASGFGFDTESTASVNASGGTYIYVAVRRELMKTPTDATKVFRPVVYTGDNSDNRLINTTIAPDFVMIRQRNDTLVPGMYTGARLTNNQFMITGSTVVAADDADSFDAQLFSVEFGTPFTSMSGVWVGNDITRKFNANTTANNHVIHAFKRASGFMDIVCYAGDGVANRTVQHNLGVAPKLIIIKRRNVGSSWLTYTTVIDGSNDYVYLSSNVAKQDATASLPTSSLFYVSSGTEVNASGSNYIAVMFGDCPGVSKVGSYTGNGTSQTINCGFTAGARYVLIKRTDAVGEWYVFDTARGITAGSDPYLLLSSTVAETTNVDTIDPANSGFVIVQNASTDLNVNSGTYIYLAIA